VRSDNCQNVYFLTVIALYKIAMEKTDEWFLLAKHNRDDIISNKTRIRCTSFWLIQSFSFEITSLGG